MTAYRDRYFHEVLLRWIGSIVIIATVLVLALAYILIGRLRMSEGAPTPGLPASAASSASPIG